MGQPVNWWLEVLKIAPTAIVGCITVYIAWRQHRIAAAQAKTAEAVAAVAASQRDIAQAQRDIAEARLKLDLFARRLEVFDAAWGAASSVLDSGNEPAYPQPTFTNLLPAAKFLFGPDVHDYLSRLSRDMIELATIKLMYQREGRFQNDDQLRKHTDLECRIADAAMSGVKDIFAPYLDFGRWK